MVIYTASIHDNTEPTSVMDKILFISILSTSTSTNKKVFKIQVPKYLLLGEGATSKCINMYGNVVTIKFWLIVNEND